MAKQRTEQKLVVATIKVPKIDGRNNTKTQLSNFDSSSTKTSFEALQRDGWRLVRESPMGGGHSNTDCPEFASLLLFEREIQDDSTEDNAV